MKKVAVVIAISAVLGVLIAVTAKTRMMTDTPTLAATRTVTLSVPGMFCETCPITVKTALNKVEGVAKVEVHLEQKEAVVTFDDSRTQVESLLEATRNAGYPSTVKP
jgi:mercuric ion binding protein